MSGISNETQRMMLLIPIVFYTLGCSNASFFSPLNLKLPDSTDTPGIIGVPNGDNNGVGVSNGSGGWGNVVLYGDEWAARFADDQTSSTWTSMMQSNLTNFWNDALVYLTASTPQKRVLFARFNTSGTSYGVTAASHWATYLPQLDRSFILTDYDSNTLGPITLSLLKNYDAFIFASYDPVLTSDMLTEYIKSGGGVMAFPIGFGTPAVSNGTAAAAIYECFGMNALFVNFPFKFDCGNANSNITASGAFANINTSTPALPFSNGYAVVPSAQAYTPY